MNQQDSSIWKMQFPDGQEITISSEIEQTTENKMRFLNLWYQNKQSEWTNEYHRMEYEIRTGEKCEFPFTA